MLFVLPKLVACPARAGKWSPGILNFGAQSSNGTGGSRSGIEPTAWSLAAFSYHHMIPSQRDMRQDMTQGVSLAQVRFDPQPTRKPDEKQPVPPSRNFGRKSASGSREMCGVDGSDRVLSTAV